MIDVDSVTRVAREEREWLLGHKASVVWLTGLPASGKSTIAYALERRLVAAQELAYVIDGDRIRGRLNSDLGYEPEDRTENVRRVAEVAALLADVGIHVIVAMIAPYRKGRLAARRLVRPIRFVEVHVATSLSVCEGRDPKGLYARAREDKLKGLTGIDAPYEEPTSPELTLDAGSCDVDTCVRRIVEYLRGSP